jgi:hypothetical protein
VLAPFQMLVIVAPFGSLSVTIQPVMALAPGGHGHAGDEAPRPGAGDGELRNGSAGRSRVGFSAGKIATTSSQPWSGVLVR